MGKRATLGVAAVQVAPGNAAGMTVAARVALPRQRAMPVEGGQGRVPVVPPGTVVGPSIVAVAVAVAVAAVGRSRIGSCVGSLPLRRHGVLDTAAVH